MQQAALPERQLVLQARVRVLVQGARQLLLSRLQRMQSVRWQVVCLRSYYRVSRAEGL